MELSLSDFSYGEHSDRDPSVFEQVYRKRGSNGVEYLREEQHRGAAVNNVVIFNQEGRWRLSGGTAYLIKDSIADHLLDDALQHLEMRQSGNPPPSVFQSPTNEVISTYPCYKLTEVVPKEARAAIIKAMSQSGVVSNLQATGKIDIESMVPATNVYFVRVSDHFIVRRERYNSAGVLIYSRYRSDIEINSGLSDLLFTIPAQYAKSVVQDEIDYGQKLAEKRMGQAAHSPASYLSPATRKIVGVLVLIVLTVPLALIFFMKKSKTKDRRM